METEYPWSGCVKLKFSVLNQIFFFLYKSIELEQKLNSRVAETLAVDLLI